MTTSNKKSCRNEKHHPRTLGLEEGMHVFWQSSIGPIACRITRLTRDFDRQCWNATVELTEDRDWHRAGKSLSDHLSKLTLEPGDSRAA